MDSTERKETAQHALVYVGVGVVIVALLILLWYAIDVVLLLFIAVLLAVLLRSPANWISRRTGWSEGWTLALVVLLAGLLLAGSAFLFGRALVQQTSDLAERLPQAISETRERLGQNEIGRWVVSAVDAGGEAGQGDFLSRGLRLVSTTMAALGTFVVVAFMAIFLASRPREYREGFVRLVAPRRRKRAMEVLDAVGDTLERWLVAQLFLMLIVAALTGIGLWWLGVPFAFPLALIAGLLEFVPYAGPVVAAVPGVLVALGESADLALWVALLYVAVQSIESYVLTPLIQHRAVDLPPALILFAQVLMGVTAGPLGVIVATPLAAAVMVAVRMLYVEDALGDRAETMRST